MIINACSSFGSRLPQVHLMRRASPYTNTERYILGKRTVGVGLVPANNKKIKILLFFFPPQKEPKSASVFIFYPRIYINIILVFCLKCSLPRKRIRACRGYMFFVPTKEVVFLVLFGIVKKVHNFDFQKAKKRTINNLRYFNKVVIFLISQQVKLNYK